MALQPTQVALLVLPCHRQVSLTQSLVLLVRFGLAGSLAELRASPIRTGCWSIDSTENSTDSFATYRDGVCLWRLLQQQLAGMRGLGSLQSGLGQS